MKPSESTEPPWHSKFDILSLSLLVFGLAALGSLPVLRGSGRSVNMLESVLRLADYFFPPDFTDFQLTLQSLLETCQMAVMSTLFAVLLSVPLALAGAQNISPRWLVFLSRQCMNAIRTVPSLIWALIAVAAFGPNPLAGVVALTFYSAGYLGKFFSDAFESVDMKIARALHAMGAHPIQAFQHGLWPHAKPLVWSQSLWMLEYNVRSAAIVGYVGAGGIGVQLHSYQEYYQWDKFCAVLICIFGLVTILDFTGERIRKRITLGATMRRS